MVRQQNPATLFPPRAQRRPTIFIGCAGWTIPAIHRDDFPVAGSHLQRYEQQFNAVEINTSFYRSHRPATYRRWGSEAPDGFQFSVKAPRTITHDHRLQNTSDDLARFLEEVAGLEQHLGPLLFQLPPSLAFDDWIAPRFFQELRRTFQGDVAFEPRHGSWLAETPLALLAEFQIGIVAADPPPPRGQPFSPQGTGRVAYFRLHGSPRMYYSDYSAEVLAEVASRLQTQADGGAEVWCIFDNTAAGAAQTNAIQMKELVGQTSG